MDDVINKCQKCEGAGWLWWNELDKYNGPASDPHDCYSDDTKYTCDECKGYRDDDQVKPNEDLDHYNVVHTIPGDQIKSMMEPVRPKMKGMAEPHITFEKWNEKKELEAKQAKQKTLAHQARLLEDAMAAFGRALYKALELILVPPLKVINWLLSKVV